MIPGRLHRREMYPLQVPGAIELLIVLVMFAVPVLLVAAVVVLLRGRRNRIADLETRIEELESTEQQS